MTEMHFFQKVNGIYDFGIANQSLSIIYLLASSWLHFIEVYFPRQALHNMNVLD